MSPPKTDNKLDAPCLTLLGEKFREQGFTKLEIEEVLGWDRNHIHLLMTGRKNLRVDEVLSILDAIGVEPEVFFAELYDLPPRAKSPRAELAELAALADGLANILVRSRLVTASELARAVASRAGKDLLPGAKEVAAEAAETPEAPAPRRKARTAEASQSSVAGKRLPPSRT